MRVLAALALVLAVVGRSAHADARVRAVAPGSAAAVAGLLEGDVVVKADGVAIRFRWNLEYAVNRARDAGRGHVALRVRRGEEERDARLGFDLAGLELVPDDPPDRLLAALLEMRRASDMARGTRAIADGLDHAAGVGDQLVTDCLALWQQGDVAAGRDRIELARFVAVCARRELLTVAEGARRARLVAELARLERRLALAAKWGARHRDLYAYASEFQKLGTNFLMVGVNLDIGLESWVKAVGMYDEIGDADNAVVVRTNLATAYLRYGRNAAPARLHAEAAWALVERYGLVLEAARVAHVRATVELVVGKPAAALEVLALGLARARELGQVDREVELEEQRAEALAALGRHAEADAVLASAQTRASDPEAWIRLEEQRAEVASASARYLVAIDRYLRALDRLRGLEEPSFTLGIEARRGLLRAYLVLGRFEEAKAMQGELVQLPPAMRWEIASELYFARARWQPGALATWSDQLAGAACLAAARAWGRAAASLFAVPPIPLEAWWRELRVRVWG